MLNVSYMEIEFTNDTVGEYASCGQCVCGRGADIGKSQYGIQTGILSYSKKDRDDTYGYTYLKKGNNAKTLDVDLKLEASQYNRVSALLTAVDGVPCILNANQSTDYEPLIVYGFIKSHGMTLNTVNKVEYNIEYEGLI